DLSPPAVFGCDTGGDRPPGRVRSRPCNGAHSLFSGSGNRAHRAWCRQLDYGWAEVAATEPQPTRLPLQSSRWRGCNRHTPVAYAPQRSRLTQPPLHQEIALAAKLSFSYHRGFQLEPKLSAHQQFNDENHTCCPIGDAQFAFVNR